MKKRSFKDHVTDRIFGVGESISHIFKSLVMGKRIPKPFVDGSDSVYAENITYDDFHAAVEHSYAKMRSEGWTINGYKKRVLDCEDFAMKLKVEMIKFISDNTDVKNVGIPVGLFGYTREDGARHVIIQVKSGKKQYFWEVYPEDRFLDHKELTYKEINSCHLFLY